MRFTAFLALAVVFVAAHESAAHPNAGAQTVASAQDFNTYESALADIQSVNVTTTPKQSDKVQITFTLDYFPKYVQQRRERAYERLSARQKSGLRALEAQARAGGKGAGRAAETLGEVFLYGNYSVPRNPAMAVKYLEAASNSEVTTEMAPVIAHAHYLAAFAYSTGLFGELREDQGRALLHYRAAADMGHIRAAMCMAYQYYAGLSVAKDEELALYYYLRVVRESREYLDVISANSAGDALPAQAISDWVFPPAMDHASIHVSSFNDGLYGEWVSEVGPGSRAQNSAAGNRPRSSGQEDGDGDVAVDEMQEDMTGQRVLEMYRQYRSNYVGTAVGGPANHTKAFGAALGCAQLALQMPEVKYYAQYGGVAERTAEVAIAARCARAVGGMYLRGEGVARNFSSARRWLVRAARVASPHDPSIAANLGAIYQYGLGVEVDTARAARMYRTAYNTPAVSYQWGRLLLAKHDPLGWRLISMAAYHRYAPALYAVLTAYQAGNSPGISRATALAHAKAFCQYAEPLVADLRGAFDALAAGNNEGALIRYGLAAEAGFESAQSSAAYLLYPPTGYLEKPPKVPRRRFLAALRLYELSARQGNLDSMVFVGDLYGRGFGTSEEVGAEKIEDGENSRGVTGEATGEATGNATGENSNRTFAIRPNPDLAVRAYREASNRRSHQASFDLGHAYEMGAGVPRDLHLAKRYYDKALSIEPDAYLPVQIALARLRLKSWWFHLMGIDSGSSQDQATLPRRTWRELLNLYGRLRRPQVRSSAINVSSTGQFRENAADQGDTHAATAGVAHGNPDQGPGRDMPRVDTGDTPADSGDTDLGGSFSDFGIEDIVFTGTFLAFIAFTVYSRWRARRRRNQREGNGNEGNQGDAGNAGNDNQPAFQFNFMVIPL